jgi:hypothetical protein
MQKIEGFIEVSSNGARGQNDYGCQQCKRDPAKNKGHVGESVHVCDTTSTWIVISNELDAPERNMN